MSFYEVKNSFDTSALEAICHEASTADVSRVLAKHTLSAEDYLVLLSEAASGMLEEMAQRANQLTMQYFGKTIQLFTPMYLSNYCSNQCVYCGFNTKNAIQRMQLSPEEVRVEGAEIAKTGLKHLLILTGEAPKKASVEYIRECTLVLREFFPSINIEVYAMQTHEYERLVSAGVDGLTIYQETYNEELYPKLHPAGPKGDYRFRLDAPERGCIAGMRVVNVGALLGLDDWRRDSFYTGMHASYLQKKFPETSIAISLPRMRPHAGEFQPSCIVNDTQLVQILMAQRIFLPRVGITISTREAPAFRDNLLPLGVTKMSAGVSTAVGGHSKEENQTGQFEISDSRTVDEMCCMLTEKGFQPVFKDWEPFDERAFTEAV